MSAVQEGIRERRGTTPDGFPVFCHFDEIVEASTLKAHPENPNQHPAVQTEMFLAAVKGQGFRRAVTISSRSGFITRGHGLTEAMRQCGIRFVPVEWQHYDSEEQELADLVADNKLSAYSFFDAERTGSIIKRLSDASYPVLATGYDEATTQKILKALETNELAELSRVVSEPPAMLPPSTPLSGGGDGEGSSESSGGGGTPAEPYETQTLSSRFLVPPFSILDARQGYWRERKQKWIAMGIRSEEGRDAELLGKESATSAYGKQNVGVDADGKLLYKDGPGNTSIFDPVLCEIAYRWFCPPAGTVLDPFAGGSVRGVIASKIGLQYVGLELREEQVKANRKQGDELCKDPMPVWHCGDSRELDFSCEGLEADLVFSCPPYADLEVYSEDPRDISTMGYEDFLGAYRQIIAKAVAKLKPNRFAVFVVGEVRDKKSGLYRSFVPDTIRAFEDAGAAFYNEAILVTPGGSLALRAGRMFTASRKLGKSHQNVLVFVKGDPTAAVEACGEVEVVLPEEEAAAAETPSTETQSTPYGELVTEMPPA